MRGTKDLLLEPVYQGSARIFPTLLKDPTHGSVLKGRGFEAAPQKIRRLSYHLCIAGQAQSKQPEDRA